MDGWSAVDVQSDIRLVPTEVRGQIPLPATLQRHGLVFFKLRFSRSYSLCAVLCLVNSPAAHVDTSGFIYHVELVIIKIVSMASWDKSHFLGCLGDFCDSGFVFYHHCYQEKSHRSG